MDNPLLLALILIAIAAVLVAVDMFIPSGGVLAILAMLAACGAVVCGFLHSVTAGSWIGIAVLAAIPLSFYIFVKIYPSTPIGRQMIMKPQDAEPYDFGGGGRNSRAALMNQIGLAETDLSPSGAISIDGRRYEASSIDGLIRAGTAVRVRDVEMGLLSVEVLREPLPLQGAEASTGLGAASTTPPRPTAAAAESVGRASVANNASGQERVHEGSLLDVPPDDFEVSELLDDEPQIENAGGGAAEPRRSNDPPASRG